ncbi:MAG: YceD family protein, partial [Pseudomonadota bacterium]
EIVGPVNWAETDDLADALGVDGVESLNVDIEVKPWRKAGLTVSGEVRIMATRTCSVTLDAYLETVAAPVLRRFSPDGERGQTNLKTIADIHFDDDDPPDALDGLELDLGEVILEAIILAMPLHPRKPDVEFDPNTVREMNENQPTDDGETNRPFANLADLVAKQSSG